jgi:hypothetical protein
VSDADRVSVLKIFVSRAMSTEVGDFVLRSSAGDVDETLLISDLPDLDRTTVSFVEFQFDSAAGPRSVHLLPTATVLDGRIALATELGQSSDFVLLHWTVNRFPLHHSDFLSFKKCVFSSILSHC